VPASVLASILYVETGCGRNTGSHMILYRLARLAMANEPHNLQRNVARFTAARGTIDPAIDAALRVRARYLENTFYPEVRATFTVANRMGVSPLDLRGSLSGAFGYPQFLPTNYLQYGVDGDGDGQVSLYDTTDAAASAGRYLAHYGWHAGLTGAQRRMVIWQYNHSDAYIETVLTLAARIEAPPTLQTAAHARRVRAKTAAAANTHRKRRARTG
jgi:membrane-bound lytic murein transglycosylase B